MEPKSAEQMLDMLTKFVDENFDKKKFGFLLMVAEDNQEFGLQFHQRTNLPSELMIEYYLNSLATCGKVVNVKRIIVEGKESEKPEIIQ